MVVVVVKQSLEYKTPKQVKGNVVVKQFWKIEGCQKPSKNKSGIGEAARVKNSGALQP